MISFRNDYSEGAHPEILRVLAETNLIQTPGYGTDEYCRQAADVIKKAAGCPDADVHFFAGGTIANLTVIASLLLPYEAAAAAKTGHINVHESGAVEATGHKILEAETPDGKLTPELIMPLVRGNADEHTVRPRLVYISNATELGTVYSKKELEELYGYCRSNDLLLFIDGARLAGALFSEYSDLTLEDTAALCDVFYIGGTKNGLLFGEAAVITNDSLKKNFRNMMKRQGAMMAKGRLLGLQFLTLFEKDLFRRNAENANGMLKKIKNILDGYGFEYLAQPQCNMIFPIMSTAQAEALSEFVEFEYDRFIDDGRRAVRFVCSWACTDEAVDAFEKAVRMTAGMK